MGEPIPDDAIPPAVLPDYCYSYSVFCELSTDREIGMALGPIRFTAIDTYARRYGIDDLDDFDQLVEDVRLLDRLFLEASKKPDK